MATAADMLDDLRDRLDDAGDTKFSAATKLRYLNRGQAAMFPKIYRIARDATLAIIADTWEYNIPTAVGSNSKITEIEIEDSNGRYHPLTNFEIVNGIADPILKLKGLSLPTAALNIRITAALPLTALATSSSTYTGPTFSEELPVLYAMSLCTGALVEKRADFRRIQTVEGFTGASPEDFMTMSQFWMQQFAQLLEQVAMPLPAGM